MDRKTVATIDDTDLEAIERHIYLLGRYLEETRFVLPAFVLAGVFYFASIRWLNDSTPGWVASALIVAVFGWDLFLTKNTLTSGRLKEVPFCERALPRWVLGL